MDKFIEKWREDSSKHMENMCSTEITSSNESESNSENIVLCQDIDEREESVRVPHSVDIETSELDHDNSEVTKHRSVVQKGRQFQSHWLETFKWLQYDGISKKVFCSVCITAYKKIKIKILSDTASANAYECFVEQGFQAWKKALLRFSCHEKSNLHRTAIVAVTSQNQGINVCNLISSSEAQARKDARFCLLKIVETIRFLAVQGISIRGHTEEDSNFIRLLHLRSTDNQLLKSWLERSKHRWISHDIINEILSLLSLNIQRKLVVGIATEPFYAVISDETTDISRHEQMSVNFRTVDENLVIREDFLGFYETPFTDAKTLFTVLNDVLIRFNLSINKCRGQCYDGAAAVSGEITGLQTRFREEEPRAFYVHCAGHNLNLVAQDAMKKVQQVADFLSVMKELVSFIRQSAKRVHIFKTLQSSFDDDDDSNEKEVGTTIKTFCFTRWCVRVKSLKAIKLNYQTIKVFCETVGKETSDAGIKARGFAHQLEKFETILMLEMAITTLEKVESLNETLQATKINFRSVIIEEIFEETELRATKLSLEEPVLPRQRKTPKRFDEKNSTAHFPSSPIELHRPIFFAIIDQIISSIDTRFDSETYEKLSAMEDFALNKCEIDKIQDYLWKDDECDFNIDRLILHRNMFHDVVEARNLTQIVDLSSISIFLQKDEHTRKYCSEFTKFIRLLLLHPQTVCVAERSFSQLKRLKNYLSSTMTQKRTNDLAMLYVHDSITNVIDLNDIVDEFIMCKENRRKIFAMRNE